MMNNQLKQWRIAKGLTQEKAADKLGIGPRHIQRIEAGTRRLTPTLERLIGIL
jgi:transcriptional regulator with XRE-family HTH domain